MGVRVTNCVGTLNCKFQPERAGLAARIHVRVFRTSGWLQRRQAWSRRKLGKLLLTGTGTAAVAYQ